MPPTDKRMYHQDQVIGVLFDWATAQITLHGWNTGLVGLWKSLLEFYSNQVHHIYAEEFDLEN